MLFTDCTGGNYTVGLSAVPIKIYVIDKLVMHQPVRHFLHLAFSLLLVMLHWMKGMAKLPAIM